MTKKSVVTFREEDHSYSYNGKKYESVNGLLELLGFKFHKEYWLVLKALAAEMPNFWKAYFSKGFNFKDNNPEPDYEMVIESFTKEIDHYDIVIEEAVVKIQDEWDLSAELGTKFHKDREDEAYKRGKLTNPFDKKSYKVQPKPDVPEGWDHSSFPDLSKLEDGAYLELLLFDHEAFLAGQADEVFIETINGVRYVDINDHKTNSKEPKYKSGSSGSEFCHYPVSHLYDCTYTKYWLQVSMYAYILSKYGFTPRHVGITHYKDYNPKKKKVIDMKYLGTECRDILELYKEHMFPTES